MRRLMMFSLAAMSASTACLGLLFLYALVAPTRQLPPIEVAITEPDANWRGGPVEDWTGAPAPRRFVTLASDAITSDAN
jgi:hypothetical protein